MHSITFTASHFTRTPVHALTTSRQATGRAGIFCINPSLIISTIYLICSSFSYILLKRSLQVFLLINYQTDQLLHVELAVDQSENNKTLKLWSFDWLMHQLVYPFDLPSAKPNGRARNAGHDRRTKRPSPPSCLPLCYGAPSRHASHGTSHACNHSHH